MIYFLMFLGIGLSIVKANGWIMVPSFCIWFCWIVSFLSWLIYAYALGASKGIKEEIEKLENKNEL